MAESLSDICADYADDIRSQQLAKLAVLGITKTDDLCVVTEKDLRDSGVLLGLISRFKKRNLIAADATGPQEAICFARSATEHWNAVRHAEIEAGRLMSNVQSILVPGLELPNNMPHMQGLKWPVLENEAGPDNLIVVVEDCSEADCECKYLDNLGRYHGISPQRDEKKKKKDRSPDGSSHKDICYIGHASCILKLNHAHRRYCGERQMDGPAKLRAFICFQFPDRTRPDVSYCAVDFDPSLSIVPGVSEGKSGTTVEKWSKGQEQGWNFRVSSLHEVFDIESPPKDPIWRGSLVFGGQSVQFYCTYTSQVNLLHKESVTFSSADTRTEDRVKLVVWDRNTEVCKFLHAFVWGLGMEAKKVRPISMHKLRLKAAGAPGPNHKDDTATFSNAVCIDLLETLYWKPDRAVVRGKLAGQQEDVVLKLAWDNLSADELKVEASALSDIQQCFAVPTVVAHGPLILKPSGFKIHLATALSPVGIDLRNAEIHGSQLCLLACRVLEALAQLQAVGRKHRDVKPQNIIQYKVDGEVDYMLVDYGAAWKTDMDDCWFSDPMWGPTYYSNPSADCESLVYTLVTVSGRTLPWKGLDSMAAYSSRMFYQAKSTFTFNLEQESPALGSFASSVMEMTASFSRPKFDMWIKMLGTDLDLGTRHARSDLLFSHTCNRLLLRPSWLLL